MKQSLPPQAKTEFEQKILNWIFRPSFLARTKRRPPAWLAPIGRQILFVQIGFLLASMYLVYMVILLWYDYLSSQRPRSFLDILIYLIDHPLEVCITVTPHLIVEVFLKWFGVASVVLVGIGFIVLRVKNWPLELRLSLACLMGAIPTYANPIIYFAMPCSVGVGVFMIFTLLSSVSAIAILVCSIRIKKWPPEMWRSVELPIEESNG